MKTTLLFLAMMAASGISHGAIIIYNAVLNGPSESPANASPGIGSAVVTLDTTLNTMLVQIQFSGLTGTTTAAHIHAATVLPLSGTAGVASTTPSFVGFPLGVTAGNYTSAVFDMTQATSYNASYVNNNGGTSASAFAALQTAMADQKAYVNIHTVTFPGGEIRGFLVPETSTTTLGALGLAGVVFARRRRA